MNDKELGQLKFNEAVKIQELCIPVNHAFFILIIIVRTTTHDHTIQNENFSKAMRKAVELGVHIQLIIQQ